MKEALELLWVTLYFVVDILKLLFLNLTPYTLRSKKSVRGEIVLVTGGGSGFGRLLAIKFAQLRSRVVIWDVDKQGNDETCRLVREIGGQIDSYILDVSIKEKVFETAKLVKEQVGPVTILVNNAGIAHYGTFIETSDALLEKVMKVNTMAHFWTLKAFLPSMVENNHGHVVCVASSSGLCGAQRASAYSASKHAVIGLMESVSFDLIESGKTGVKCTVVCPYFSNTPLFEAKYNGFFAMVEPEVVVQDIVKGVLTDKDVVYVPRTAYGMTILNLIATKKALYKLFSCMVGTHLPTTIKIRTVFKEQELT